MTFFYFLKRRFLHLCYQQCHVCVECFITVCVCCSLSGFYQLMVLQ